MILHNFYRNASTSSFALYLLGVILAFSILSPSQAMDEDDRLFGYTLQPPTKSSPRNKWEKIDRVWGLVIKPYMTELSRALYGEVNDTITISLLESDFDNEDLEIIRNTPDIFTITPVFKDFKPLMEDPVRIILSVPRKNLVLYFPSAWEEGSFEVCSSETIPDSFMLRIKPTAPDNKIFDINKASKLRGSLPLCRSDFNDCLSSSPLIFYPAHEQLTIFEWYDLVYLVNFLNAFVVETLSIEQCSSCRKKLYNNKKTYEAIQDYIKENKSSPSSHEIWFCSHELSTEVLQIIMTNYYFINYYDEESKKDTKGKKKQKQTD